MTTFNNLWNLKFHRSFWPIGFKVGETDCADDLNLQAFTCNLRSCVFPRISSSLGCVTASSSKASFCRVTISRDNDIAFSAFSRFFFNDAVRRSTYLENTNNHCCSSSPWDNGLVQERCNSSALAMELGLSCTNPLICHPQYWWSLVQWIYHHTLTHCGLVTHMMLDILVIAGFGNSLVPLQHQTFTWNNVDCTPKTNLTKFR